jgi:hypothetical protein
MRKTVVRALMAAFINVASYFSMYYFLSPVPETALLVIWGSTLLVAAHGARRGLVEDVSSRAATALAARARPGSQLHARV